MAGDQDADPLLGGDALAGVVDLFGGMSRPELRQALAELAFRRGDDLGDESSRAAIDGAIDDMALVSVRQATEAVLVPGPSALPTLPEHAADLPHILDIEPRDVPDTDRAEAVLERLDAAADEAVTADDPAAAERVLDQCYEAAAWGPVDVAPIRDRLDDVLD